MGESQNERDPHPDEREGDDSGNTERKRVDSTVKKRRLREGEGGQARTTSLGEIEGTMSV